MKSKSKPVTKPVLVTLKPVPVSRLVKIKPAYRTRTGAVAWRGASLARILSDARKRAHSNSFESIGLVVCCSQLPHGLHVELNVFGRGNNCFRVVPDYKWLEPGGIYKFHVSYDDDGDEEVIDEFVAGTISSARYLGRAKSISDASRRMTLNIANAVADMLSYNTAA